MDIISEGVYLNDLVFNYSQQIIFEKNKAMIKLIVNYTYSVRKRIGTHDPEPRSKILTFENKHEISDKSICEKLYEGDSYINIIKIEQIK